MRKSFILAMAAIVLSASTCQKLEPGDYKDYKGVKINLLGSWALTEVQYCTAGVIETRKVTPESVMEFAPKGIGYTKDMEGNILDSWHYETFRAAVTIFTNAEWENNRGLGEDDNRYQRGKTYYFHVEDENTLSCQEKVSANSYIVNFFSRVNALDGRFKDLLEDMYSPDTLIIMYDPEIGKEPLLAAIVAYGAEIKYDYSIIPALAIRIPEGADIHSAIAWFKQVKGVTSVERDQIIRLTDPVKPRVEIK